jgi:hypothetical protein
VAANEEGTPVVAKVVLVDPASMEVTWLNESAAEDAESDTLPLPLARAVPMAEMLGLPDALHAVAGDGMPRHLRTGLVSTHRGRMTIATSVYRLPHGSLLVVTEHGWEAAHRPAREDTSRNRARRSR